MKRKFLWFVLLTIVCISCQKVTSENHEVNIVGWWECVDMSENGIQQLNNGYRCYVEFTSEKTVAMYDNLINGRLDPVLFHNYWGGYEKYEIHGDYLYSYSDDYSDCGFFGCLGCSCGYNSHLTTIKQLTQNRLELMVVLNESEDNHVCIFKLKRATKPHVVQ